MFEISTCQALSPEQVEHLLTADVAVAVEIVHEEREGGALVVGAT